ncbi:MAG: phosphate propanoyltransferase [Patescibacteria group bacterium]|jgi:putative phosphotransacetylase
MHIPIEVSARHIHLTAADIAVLFGEGYILGKHRVISQPGQFSSVEKVIIKGPKGEMAGVRVVGPARKKTQVELSMTDCRTLGVEAMLRVSGDLTGTPGGVTIIGPKGEITLIEGVIVPQRHLHIEPEYAEALGLTHGDTIAVKVEGERAVTLHNVAVRSREGIDALALHIDTDEGNTAGVIKPTYASFIGKE